MLLNLYVPALAVVGVGLWWLLGRRPAAVAEPATAAAPAKLRRPPAPSAANSPYGSRFSRSGAS